MFRKSPVKRPSTTTFEKELIEIYRTMLGPGGTGVLGSLEPDQLALNDYTKKELQTLQKYYSEQIDQAEKYFFLRFSFETTILSICLRIDHFLLLTT